MVRHVVAAHGGLREVRGATDRLLRRGLSNGVLSGLRNRVLRLSHIVLRVLSV